MSIYNKLLAVAAPCQSPRPSRRHRCVIASAIWIAIVIGGAAALTYAQEASTDELSPETVAKIPDLAGNWTGSATVTKTGETSTIMFNIDQKEGSGALHGTWTGDEGTADFTGSVNAKDAVKLILDYPFKKKHPNCKINATGVVSDNVTEISGSWKFSAACGDLTGETGTFELRS